MLGVYLLGTELGNDVAVDRQAAHFVAILGLGHEPAGAQTGHLGRGGQLYLLHVSAGDVLDATQAATLLGRDEGQRRALAPGAPSAADAVDVGVDLARHVEVDHQPDALHVEPAGGDVGGYQHVERAGAQAIDKLLPVALLHVTGEGCGLHAAGG